MQSTGMPLDGPLRRDMESRFGHPFAQVRVHTDAPAARSALALNANAYTVGNHIAFAPGRFAPGSAGGQRLLAHELAHITQQSRGGPAVIQRDVINMEPITITDTLRPTGSSVSNLGRLCGEGVVPGDMTATRDDATIASNAPNPATVLPFAAGGWNATAILTALGQYDTLPGTDSDALRCVQAVAMAARIPDGPAAVIGFLRAMILEGMLSRSPTPRQQTALEVLEHVIGRIETARATFGDLLWAQEAMHDMFYNDVSGTPESEIRDRLAPALELGMSMSRMDVWCNSPAEVIAQANLLQPGEKLLVNTWQVVFNTAFDQLEEQGITVAEGGSQVVEVNGRRVRIRRISSAARPAHAAIDAVRDSRSGHQLMVFKDGGASGALRLYEPEITTTGAHLETLAADGSNFTRYFQDLPDVGIFNYIQIIGKLVPSPMSSGAWTTP
jgi:Domain of unknown function (DUF4157)